MRKEDISAELNVHAWSFGFKLEFTNTAGKGVLQTFQFNARTKRE